MDDTDMRLGIVLDSLLILFNSDPMLSSRKCPVPTFGYELSVLYL